MAIATFDIAFTETPIPVESISSNDLGEMIGEVETAVALVAAKMHPEIDAEKVRVGLIGVKPKAVEYTFASTTPDVIGAIDQIIASLDARSYQSVPARALRSLKGIDAFRRELGAGIQWSRDGSTRMARINQTDDLELPELEILSGETVIYGQLTRAGGTPPKLRLRLQDGTPLSVITTEALARSAGGLLYEPIGLRGRAEWDVNSATVISFRADELLPYRQKSAVETVKRLREATAAIQSDWDTLEGGDALIREMRDR